MDAKSRTEYSARNTTVALISRLTAILMGYVLRVVFTHTLSESYVGVNGLFFDIINVFSLSEMGIGTAVTYALYRPIAEEDLEKQKSLMKLFCGFYRTVAVVVSAAGLMLIPFMDIIIKDYQSIEHLTFIYLLYLANTICSYLLVYKKLLIDAHQLNYIGTLYQTTSWVVQDILQILVLVLTKNFVLFLLINILTTVVCNICISRRADKLYPYLKAKEIQTLPKEERGAIFQNIRAMLMHKIGMVVVNNTDNLILSAFTGLANVGSYSNYYLVIGSVRQLSTQVFQGITASVGNLEVTEKKERVKRVFEASFFIGQWMYGAAVICLYELLNPFVELSFGKQYLFPKEIVMILCMNFFINGMRDAALIFRDSLGLFWHDRYKAVAEAVLNLAISVILVQQVGVIGVFLGTLFSMLATSVWVEPYVLYKYEFQTSCMNYFARYFVYILGLAAAWLTTDALCTRVGGGALAVLIQRLFISVLAPSILFLIFYHRTKEFAFLTEKLVQLLKKRRERR